MAWEMMVMVKIDMEMSHAARFGKTVTKVSKRNIQHSQGSSSQRMIICIPIIHTTSMVYDTFYRLWKILIYLFSKSIYISCIENWPIRHISKMTVSISKCHNYLFETLFSICMRIFFCINISYNYSSHIVNNQHSAYYQVPESYFTIIVFWFIDVKYVLSIFAYLT